MKSMIIEKRTDDFVIPFSSYFYLNGLRVYYSVKFLTNDDSMVIHLEDVFACGREEAKDIANQVSMFICEEHSISYNGGTEILELESATIQFKDEAFPRADIYLKIKNKGWVKHD